MRFFLVASLLVMPLLTQGAGLTDAQLERVGRKIFENEAGGKVSGLVDWNAGEAFASLGIGHFIWYPAGKRGPFEESFPAWVAFALARGERPPAWLAARPDQPCPWPDRATFQRERAGAKATELRQWLASTFPAQAA